MRSENLERWFDRLERAAALLSARPDDMPSLDELASIACVSPFHFHRIWRGLTGETVGETMARLRAERAEMLLAQPGASVTDVAMELGYSSSQSFARAFRARTGMTPSQAKGGAALHESTPDASPEIKLVVRDRTQVVAMRRRGGAYVALNTLFQAVWDWAEQAGAINRLRGLYGVPLDDPGSVPENLLRYDACLALGEVQPPEPFRLIELPTGRHARLRHHGGYVELEALDQWLVGTWLPRSGFEPADAPLYHHFHNDPETTREKDLITDILLPLATDQESSHRGSASAT